MRTIAFVLGLFMLVALPAGAHEGHDHGAPPPPVNSTIAPRMEASSTTFELVAVAREGAVDIYIDGFLDNSPVLAAVVEVDTRDGVLAAEEIEPGVYRIDAPWARVPGTYDLAVTVIADAGLDVLVGSLAIPEAPPPSVVEASEASVLASDVLTYLRDRLTLRDAALLVVGAAAFAAGALLVLAWRRAKWAAATAAAGILIGAVTLWWPFAARAEAAMPAAAPPVVVRDLAQRTPDGSLFVPKATQRVLGIRTILTEVAEHSRSTELPGRIIPDPNASGVVQASLDGRLVAPAGGFSQLGDRVQAGEVLAIVEPTIGTVDIVDRQQQLREIDQQIKLATRRLDLRRRLESVVSRTQIEELEIELEGLTEQREALRSLSDLSEDLRAPVSGVIASRQAVPGQIVAPGATVYQIVDPERLWVEALSYRAEPIGPEAVAVLADGTTVDLVHVGTGLADEGQAVPVQFSLTSDEAGPQVGQLVRVIASSLDRQTGIAVPRDAVLRGSNGQTIVYAKTNAERFVAREVRVEPMDGETVLVVSGLEPGLRVVSAGAELLNQIR